MNPNTQDSRPTTMAATTSTTTTTTPSRGGGGSGRRSRELLKPWLEAQVRSGLYPGVEWLDEPQRIFRIGWKHFRGTDWTEEDGLLFKAWAVHNGRYNEATDKLDYPTWKTRMRCALTKVQNIQELRHMKSEDELDPYHVYQFLDGPEGCSASPSPPQQQQHRQRSPPSARSEDSVSCSGTDSPVPSPALCPRLQTPSPPAHGDPQPNIPTVVFDDQPHPLQYYQAQQQQLQQQQLEQQLQQLQQQQQQQPEVAQELYDEKPCNSGDLAGLGSDLKQLSITNLMTTERIDVSEIVSIDSNINSIDLQSMETDSLKDRDRVQPSQSQKPEDVGITNHFLTLSPIINRSLTLTLRYRTTIAGQYRVTNGNGCRLFRGGCPPLDLWNQELFGHPQADQCPIPDSQVTCVTPRAAEETARVLDGLELGVSIGLDPDNNILIRRRCKVRVHAAPPNQPLSQSVSIGRKCGGVRIFDWEAFNSALQLHLHGQGPRPSPLVVVSFGQDICCDDAKDPYASLYLSVTVTHAGAEDMLRQMVPLDQPVEFSYSNEFEQELQNVKHQANKLFN